MAGTFHERLDSLARNPRRWLVSGAAGFIGSNLTEILLGAGQEVVGLDNFVTGKAANLADLRGRVGEVAFERFTFIEGDIRNAACCERACEGVDFVLHHAALISVPQSLLDPLLTDEINVGGFVRLLEAARRGGVKRVVYASSSAVYGEQADPPNQECLIGEALSPYALTKRINELYAAFYTRTYGLTCVGLRYFNVFGPRQDPAGAYAAVIPRWAEAMLQGHPCKVFGDGSSTRDFCHVFDVAQANILAATTDVADGRVFNVGSGREQSLLDLLRQMAEVAARYVEGRPIHPPRHEPPRPGDIYRSSADISRIRADLGFEPAPDFAEGLATVFERLVG